MVNRGETAAAWPLLEESLRTFRQLGLPRGEAQVLGYLSEKAHGDRDLALASELSLESARIAHEADWTWWEAGQLCGAATFERERGNLDAAETHALRALELSLGLGDRRRVVPAASELAILAVERGDPERAGRIWGAVESEVSSGPAGGQWERHHEELERLVLRANSPAFSHAQEEGSLMSISEAAGLVAGLSEPLGPRGSRPARTRSG
jgi:non-specific serine/threonine protein kinase